MNENFYKFRHTLSGIYIYGSYGATFTCMERVGLCLPIKSLSLCRSRLDYYSLVIQIILSSGLSCGGIALEGAYR